MILFKDFVPEETTPAKFFVTAQYEAFESAVARANAWISQVNAKVVNVETVVLPNIHSPREEGSTDPHIRASGELSTYWYQFVRVWYETDQ